MLKWEEAPSVYLFTRPIDMRCGCDRLADLVRSEIGQNPLKGGLYVYVSRNRRRVKMLFWDKDGYWLLYKRLEAGVFGVGMSQGYEEISGVDLKLLLEGIDLSRIKFRKEVKRGVYG